MHDGRSNPHLGVHGTENRDRDAKTAGCASTDAADNGGTDEKRQEPRTRDVEHDLNDVLERIGRGDDGAESDDAAGVTDGDDRCRQSFLEGHLDFFALIEILPHKTQCGQSRDKDRRFHGEAVAADLDVDQRDADDEREQCEDEGRKILVLLRCEIIIRSLDEVFPFLFCVIEPEFQVCNTRNTHEGDGDEADHSACHVAGSQVCRRNRIVNLDGTWSDHTKGRNTIEQRTGKGPPGKIGLTPDFQGDREYAECTNVRGNAAIGKNGAGDRDGNERPVLTDALDDRLRDTPRTVSDVHEFRKNRTCQEQQEVILEEPNEPCHVGLLECFIGVQCIKSNNDRHTDENSQIQVEIPHDEEHQ